MPWLCSIHAGLSHDRRQTGLSRCRVASRFFASLIQDCMQGSPGIVAGSGLCRNGNKGIAMSIELSRRTGDAHEYPPADPWAGQSGDGNARGLRRQAAQIIAAVLSDSTPEQARARARLRRWLQAYPGRPEIALAEHLIALREEAARVETPTQPSGPGAEGTTDPSPGVDRPILHQRPTLRVHYGHPDRSAPSGTSKDGN